MDDVIFNGILMANAQRVLVIDKVTKTSSPDQYNKDALGQCFRFGHPISLYILTRESVIHAQTEHKHRQQNEADFGFDFCHLHLGSKPRFVSE
jgi:hypothetical protein